MMVATKTYSVAELKALIIDLLAQIAPEADFEDLDDDEDIREALDIDSFDFLNFLIALNEQTGVEIPEADYGQLNTMEELLAYLNVRL
jgi:acyl carrier protein